MKFKTKLLLFCTITTVILCGCSQNQSVSNQNNKIPSIIKTNDSAPIVLNSEPTYDSATLKLEKAPAVNETVSLEFLLDDPNKNHQQIEKIWIEFEYYDPSLYYPLGRDIMKDWEIRNLAGKTDSNDPNYMFHEALAAKQPESKVANDRITVSGTFEWDSSYQTKESPIHLGGDISFPKVGEWLISIWYKETNVDPFVRDSLKLTIGKTIGTIGWLKTYQPSEGQSVMGEGYNFGLDLRLIRAMPVSTETEIICTINTIKDIKDLSTELEFYYVESGSVRRELVATKDVVSEGEATWSGTLKANSTIVLPIKVKFPKEGDWEVRFIGHSSDSQVAFISQLYLYTDQTQGIAGWVEPHQPKIDLPIRSEK